MRDEQNMPKDLFAIWAFVVCSVFGGVLIYLALAVIGWLVGVQIEPYSWLIIGVAALVASYLLQHTDWQ